MGRRRRQRKIITPQTRGLSYLDANRDCLVEFAQDVLDYKAEIIRRWPNLDVYWDKDRLVWVIVELNCKDGCDKLVFDTPSLGQHTIDRINRADQNIDASDPCDLVDAWNALREKEQEDKFENRLGEASERLLHALKKDNIGGILQVAPHGPRRSKTRA